MPGVVCNATASQTMRRASPVTPWSARNARAALAPSTSKRSWALRCPSTSPISWNIAPMYSSSGSYRRLRRAFDAAPQAGGDARAELAVDVRPVVDHARLNGRSDPGARVRDDVAREALAIAVVHHVAIERAGLDEVVVGGVLLVGVAADLARLHPPGRQLLAGIRLRAAV